MICYRTLRTKRKWKLRQTNKSKSTERWLRKYKVGNKAIGKVCWGFSAHIPARAKLSQSGSSMVHCGNKSDGRRGRSNTVSLDSLKCGVQVTEE
ncbi:hypothetical protein GJAV_G00192290 [Gymnothorax javanicus]|nr:hypothetical protein GJAV_G00192290 [Gymnothorax javanicus]